jgi:hypothetical protein
VAFSILPDRVHLREFAEPAFQPLIYHEAIILPGIVARLFLALPMETTQLVMALLMGWSRMGRPALSWV